MITGELFGVSHRQSHCTLPERLLKVCFHSRTDGWGGRVGYSALWQYWRNLASEPCGTPTSPQCNSACSCNSQWVCIFFSLPQYLDNTFVLSCLYLSQISYILPFYKLKTSKYYYYCKSIIYWLGHVYSTSSKSVAIQFQGVPPSQDSTQLPVSLLPQEVMSAVHWFTNAEWSPRNA